MTGRIKQRNKDIAIYATPYKFNGKELDEETGLYYYGARYLHPKYAMWLSTDPLERKYPNVSSYTYCHDNPIMRKDHSGNPGLITDELFDENRQILFNEALYKFGWKDMISERYGGKLLPHSRSAKELRIKSSHDNHLHLQGFKPNVIDMYLDRDLNEIVIKP